MNKDRFRTRVLSTEQASLYCTIEDGTPQMEYFSFRDIYSTYRVNLDYDDLCEICQFLEKWGSEPVVIIQPYSTKVNGSPSFCALKFEYVKNEKKDMIRDEFQRVTFYSSCWGKDLQDSLDDEKCLSWSYWDDYYNWDGFEALRSFMYNMKRLVERSAGWEDE